MQREAGGSAAAVRFKCDLGIDHFEEELAFTLGEYLEFRLAGSLSEQRIAFAGDGEYEIGCQLILAHIAVKQLRIDFDFLVLFGLRELTFIPLGGWSWPPWCRITSVARPWLSGTKVSCASNSLTKKSRLLSGKIGNLGWPVAWVTS